MIINFSVVPVVSAVSVVSALPALPAVSVVSALTLIAKFSFQFSLFTLLDANCQFWVVTLHRETNSNT